MKHIFEEKTSYVLRALRYFCMGKESKALELVETHHLMVTPFLEMHTCPEIKDFKGTLHVANPRYYGVFKLTTERTSSKHEGICIFNISELFKFSKFCENKLKGFRLTP